MASTFSDLKVELMGTGDNSGTWGEVLNDNLGVALEEAIAETADIAFSDANQTITLTDVPTSQVARHIRLNLTGTATAGYNLVVPTIEKPYIINNATDGTITVKTSAGTGVAVPSGKSMWVYVDGTNVVDVVTYISSLSVAGITLSGTDLQTALDLKAALASPTFTGVVTAPALVVTGAVDETKGATVASATTTNIWATDGNSVHVSGTTNITSFGTAPRAGARRVVIFDGALTLTHSANLNLPGGADITTAAGDSLEVFADTTTQLDVLRFTRASGKAVTPSIGAIPITAYGDTSITLALADAYTFVTLTPTTPQTITVPPNSTVAFDVGCQISGAGLGASTVTFVEGAGVTILTTETLQLRKQNACWALVKLSTNTWVLTGDLELA